LATAVGTGVSTISATLGAVSGSTVLTVTGPALQSIAVTPANPSITKGSTQQFTATGTYSDNSTQNLTAQVTWNSSAPAVATISATGLATAVGAGTSTITASLVGVLSNSAILTVTAPVPATIVNVSSTVNNGSYGIGAVIPITVTFSKPVAVTGVPLLSLNSGGIAAFGSGSGTSTLTFLYTVAGGQNSPDLDAASSGALSANGGTINDTLGAPAVLILPAPGAAGSLGANKDIVVDTVAPTVVSYNVRFGSSSYSLPSTRNRLPWQITGIQVVFSKPIVSGNVSSLAGVTATNLAGLGTNTLTWTISPLSVGNFTTALSGSGANALLDVAGNPLRSGAGFTQGLKVLWGDFNDDGIVNASDLAAVFNATVSPYNVFADLNGDGIVNTSDVQVARTRVGAILP